MKITVSTTEFEFSHGRKPRGFGIWIFEVGNDIFESGPMNYGDAVKAAKKFAVACNTTAVKLLP